MKWFAGMRTDKKFALVMIIVLLIFLALWVTFYPWEMEEGEESGESSVAGSEEAESVSKPESILADMTLEEKVYQMFIVSPEQITGVDTVVAAGEATRQALSDYPVGGIMYSSGNMLSQEQIQEVITNSQAYSEINLFIAVDEEGGSVSRLMDTVGTTKIDSMYSYKDEGTKTAEENAETIASDISALGFNLDFAPVADVWSNPVNTVIGERAYSDDFGEAAKLVKSAVKGFHEGGVLCTLKHFPGHGDTAEDTHTSVAYVTKTKKELEKEELQTFKAGIKEGADLVMVGHMIVQEIDDTEPASLSSAIVTDMLRDEMKFDGLIITDALNMAAVSGQYSAGEAAVMAVNAGNDMLLEPADLSEAVNAIVQAVGSGDISEERINESVLCILEAKYNAGILD